VFHIHVQLRDNGLTAASKCKIRACGRTGKRKTKHNRILPSCRPTAEFNI